VCSARGALESARTLDPCGEVRGRLGSRLREINEASRMTRPSGGGLRNEVEQSRLLPMILAHAAFVAAILNEKTSWAQWVIETVLPKVYAGVFQRKVSRGRVFNFLATVSNCAWLTPERSKPLGKY